MKQPLFEILDTILLDELGYDVGSEAQVNINGTREWEIAWSRVFDMKPEDGESEADFTTRFIEMQYPLAAMMIKKVTLNPKGGESVTWDNITPESLKEIDNLDPMIMSVVMRERDERNAERALHTTLTFRERRSDALQARKEGRFKGSIGGNKPVDDNKTPE